MAEIIVALDLPSAGEALQLVDRIGETADFYKVGAPLFTRVGPSIIEELNRRDKRVFLDLKYHDIPNTVANAVAAAADLGVDLLTVHTTGGRAMLEAARTAAPRGSGPRILGVTLLTSLSAVEVGEIWDRGIDSLPDEVARLAASAADAELDGVVASPLEASALKELHGPGFLVVTPGIRPAGGQAGDQTRIATPAAAAGTGADYLVIGRPVLTAKDPVEVIASIRSEIDQVEGDQG